MNAHKQYFIDEIKAARKRGDEMSSRYGGKNKIVKVKDSKTICLASLAVKEKTCKLRTEIGDNINLISKINTVNKRTSTMQDRECVFAVFFLPRLV